MKIDGNRIIVLAGRNPGSEIKIFGIPGAFFVIVGLLADFYASGE
jgi:hypothetical protein